MALYSNSSCHAIAAEKLTSAVRGNKERSRAAAMTGTNVSRRCERLCCLCKKPVKFVFIFTRKRYEFKPLDSNPLKSSLCTENNLYDEMVHMKNAETFSAL